MKMSLQFHDIRKSRAIGVFLIIGAAVVLVVLASSCELRNEVPGSAAKVAKVDTDYVYEGNISKYVEDYRQYHRVRISPFIGFTPDEILIAREEAIDDEIRKEIKRLPGVDIQGPDVRALANTRMEELAWDIYRQLTEEGADFARLAREYSDTSTARTGGLLQPFGMIDNAEPYQRLAYTMPVGEISEPFSGADGWRIIRLDSVEHDPLVGDLYHISMIRLTPDLTEAEAELLNRIAEEHTIEILDPKYNSRRALADGDYQTALDMAEEAISRNEDDELGHYLRARALWQLDRKDEALEELEIAAEVGRVSDALVPYYHYYRGEYLEELGRTEDALEAYRASYAAWRQDINIAYDLLDAYERLEDTEYAEIMEQEIADIAAQDSVVLTFGEREAATEGVIVTGEGRHEGVGSAEYEPGYRE